MVRIFMVPATCTAAAPVCRPATCRQNCALRDASEGSSISVSRRFIDILEGFQKEVQYFPVECSWTDGSPAGQFFFFFTTVLLDAVIREKTTATWTPTGPGEGLWQPKGDEAFAFDKSRLGNTHMWVDPNMPTEGALITEALHDALRDAKIESFYEWTYSEEI